MAKLFTLNGIKDGGTFQVAKGTVKANEVVGLAGGKIVKTAGTAPLGFVEQVEIGDETNDVISVIWHRAYEIPGTGLTAGDYVACDGKGGVQKATDYLGAKVIDVGEGYVCVLIG